MENKVKLLKKMFWMIYVFAFGAGGGGVGVAVGDEVGGVGEGAQDPG